MPAGIYQRLIWSTAEQVPPLCAVKPLDKGANANGQRRALSPAAVDLSPVAPVGLPALMTQLLADYAATGVPPAYLPIMPTPITPTITDEVCP